MQTLGVVNRKQKYKLGIMGAAKVGKSALLARFQDNNCFVEDYIPTVLDTIRQQMIFEDPTEGRDREVTLEIKDVGRAYWREKLAIGNDAMKEELLHEQDALIFCFDVTNVDSFYALSPMF